MFARLCTYVYGGKTSRQVPQYRPRAVDPSVLLGHVYLHSHPARQMHAASQHAALPRLMCVCVCVCCVCVCVCVCEVCSYVLQRWHWHRQMMSQHWSLSVPQHHWISHTQHFPPKHRHSLHGNAFGSGFSCNDKTNTTIVSNVLARVHSHAFHVCAKHGWRVVCLSNRCNINKTSPACGHPCRTRSTAACLVADSSPRRWDAGRTRARSLKA